MTNAIGCFKFAIDTKQDLWFATKDTISKTYDAQFRKIFEEVYATEQGCGGWQTREVPAV